MHFTPTPTKPSHLDGHSGVRVHDAPEKRNRLVRVFVRVVRVGADASAAGVGGGGVVVISRRRGFLAGELRGAEYIRQFHGVSVGVIAQFVFRPAVTPDEERALLGRNIRLDTLVHQTRRKAQSAVPYRRKMKKNTRLLRFSAVCFMSMVTINITTIAHFFLTKNNNKKIQCGPLQQNTIWII